MAKHTVHSEAQEGHIFHAPLEYKKLMYLSEGTFGVVCSAVRDQKQVAVKRVCLRSAVWAECALRELHSLTQFARLPKSAGVVRLLDCWWHSGSLYMALELFDNSLQHYMCKDDAVHLTEEQWMQVAKNLTRAVATLHSAGAMHRDLKPGNIVVSSDFTRLALIDLGTVRADAKHMRVRPLTPIHQVATEGFQSPESLKGDGTGYSSQLDVFSTGTVLCGLLMGEELFPTIHDLEKYIAMRPQARNEWLLHKIGMPPKSLPARLLKRMLDVDPLKRASVFEVLKLLGEGRNDLEVPYAELDYNPNETASIVSRIKELVDDFHTKNSEQTTA